MKGDKEMMDIGNQQRLFGGWKGGVFKLPAACGGGPGCYPVVSCKG